MSITIDTISLTSPARQEMARFLAHFEAEDRGEDFWLARMSQWWEKNPFKADGLPLGWVARHESAIVGFMAAIPFPYSYRGQTHPALGAGTWRVARTHRNISLPMFMKWHQLRLQCILLDTTPSKEVSVLLERFGYHARKTVHRYLYPLWPGDSSVRNPLFALLNLFARWSRPRRPLRVVSINDSFGIRRPWAHYDRLEKSISREYLSWYCQWPQKEFVGCVDHDNMLSSYIILEPARYGKYLVLSLIDSFTTRPDNVEIMALAGHVLTHPARLSLKGAFSFLMLNTLDEDWGKGWSPGAIHRQDQGKHYYWLPPHLGDVPKRCVIAEGDYGC